MFHRDKDVREVSGCLTVLEGIIWYICSWFWVDWLFYLGPLCILPMLVVVGIPVLFFTDSGVLGKPDTRLLSEAEIIDLYKKDDIQLATLYEELRQSLLSEEDADKANKNYQKGIFIDYILNKRKKYYKKTAFYPTKNVS